MVLDDFDNNFNQVIFRLVNLLLLIKFLKVRRL